MVSLADLSVSRKLAYGFAAVVAVIVAVSASSWLNLSKTEANNALTDHAYQALSVINQVATGAADQQNALRAFLLSGDEARLAPYRKAQGSYAEAVSAATNLISAPAMIADLGDLKRAADAWRTDVAEKEIALAAQPGGLDEARKLDASEPGKLETVLAKAAHLREAELGILKDATTQSAQSLSLAYWVVAVGLLIAVSLASGLSVVLGRMIADPIKAMTRAMTALAGGDKSVAIPALDRHDEVGQMAGAVQVFKDNMLRADQSGRDQEAKRQTDDARAKALLALAVEFDRSISGSLDAVSAAAGDLQATAGNLTNSAEITTSQSAVVTSAANEASSNVQTVAAAAEELSSSINEISRQVSHSARIAGEAVAEADRTDVIVRGLADAAGRIGDVVNLINDIAAQTNLLALNATIEAARAGEAGKGFAVVANEVKTLANQTAKATGEITGQITAVQSATKDAVSAIQGIGSTIGQINEIATTIASAVEEQGAATQEIARNVQQAAFGTQEVTVNIAGVSEAAIETGNSAHDVLNSSTALSREANQLKGMVQSFLRNLRSA